MPTGSRIATRCLARPAAPTLFLSPTLASSRSPLIHRFLVPQHRYASWFNWGRGKSKQSDSTSDDNVPESRYLRELLKASPKGAGNSLLNYQPERGRLSSTSIFEDESPTIPDEEEESTTTLLSTDYLKTVDPHREKSWSWPRRFQARMHRRRNRLTRPEKIRQTERSHSTKSHFLKTSIKKLAPLARQIAGLKLNDAIVQMRFSPKKPSTEILQHLLQARNEAVVRKGMAVDEMYVDQAWVGRGPYEDAPNHRARGRVDIMKRPCTSITVVLKEEATRQRIAIERKEKRLRQKVWVQLPDRPIYGQRQYYQW